MIMKNPRCLNCKANKICRDENISWFFIIIGFISTVAIRVVTVLMDIDPVIGKAAWYIGITGFSIFFMYKYKVFKDRGTLIDKMKLLEKVNGRADLKEDDYEVLSIVLCEIRSNKERINFLFIFIVSALALLAAVYSDFIMH